MAEQANDDTHRVARQMFRDSRGSKQRTITIGRSEEYRGHERSRLAYDEPGFAEVEGALSPEEPQVVSDTEAQLATVRAAVAGLSAFEQRVYELAYGGGYVKSSREVAHELDEAVSYKTVQRALDRIKAAVVAALEEDQSEGNVPG